MTDSKGKKCQMNQGIWLFPSPLPTSPPSSKCHPLSNKTENNTGRILFKTTSPKGLPFLMGGDTASDNSRPEPGKRQPRPGTVDRRFPTSLQWEDKVTGETKGFKGISAMDQRQTQCDSIVSAVVGVSSEHSTRSY